MIIFTMDYSANYFLHWLIDYLVCKNPDDSDKNP